MRTVKFIITLIIGIGLVIYCGHVTQRLSAQTGYEAQATSDGLRSVAEFQEYLNELEPRNPIEVDGILGPETQAKWESIWMNNQAVRYQTQIPQMDTVEDAQGESTENGNSRNK